MEEFGIAWSVRAYKDLQQIRRYLRKNSSDAVAEKVVSGIISATEPLRTQPERFRKDPFLLHKERNIRYFQKWSYRVIYEFTGQEIYIARVLHSSRDLKKVLKDFK